MTALDSKKWFVVYTKPRNEIKVSQRLSVLGVENYTPTRIEVRQWSDRKKKILVPLLPSMVLVSLHEKDVNKVFETPGVVRYLFENQKRVEVSEEEVLAMKYYLDNSYHSNKEELAVGETVKVPLLEKEAIVISIKGKNCIAQLKKMGAIVSFQLN
ncbi:antitermination protein NusG [bacterium]|nr:antitermination protein NusG [bacterium]